MPPDLNQLLSGLEARLSHQLSQDREAIFAAIGSGDGIQGPVPGGGGVGPIVLMPDEPMQQQCATCGRAFEPLRMAIHARSWVPPACRS